MGRRSKTRQQKLKDENSVLNKIGAMFDNLPNPAGIFFETNEPWRLSQGRWLPRGKIFRTAPHGPTPGFPDQAKSGTHLIIILNLSGYEFRV